MQGRIVERAKPVEMRQYLILVDELKKAGIAFIPIPIIGDKPDLCQLLEKRLDLIERCCDRQGS